MHKLKTRQILPGQFNFVCCGCDNKGTTAIWLRQCEVGKSRMFYETDVNDKIVELCADCLKRVVLCIDDLPEVSISEASSDTKSFGPMIEAEKEES